MSETGYSPSTGERLRELLVGRLTFPLLNACFNRRSVLPMLRERLVTETLPAAELQRLRLERLRGVLAHAEAQVPFWRERFHDAGLAPEKVRSFDDLACLPPSTRDDILERLPDMVDTRHREEFARIVDSPSRGEPVAFARLRGRRLIRNSTSGSTGQPMVCFEDGSTAARAWTNDLRLRHWFGLGPGAREARLSISPHEFDPAGRRTRWRGRLWNQIVMPGRNLGPGDYAANIRLLDEFRPRILWGRTSGLAGMAEYLADNPRLTDWRPELVTTWSEPLLAHQKLAIEAGFGCPTSNLYSCRETSHLGALCPAGRLHVFAEDFHVEQAQPGQQPSLLLVTALFPTPMPFIRYALGDLGVLSVEPCPCGRTLPVIDRLDGRNSDVHQLPDGRRIATGFWTALFAANPLCRTVRRYQIVYGENHEVRLRIVPSAAYSNDIEAHLRRQVETQYGYPYTIQYPEAIEPAPSGKFPLIVHES